MNKCPVIGVIAISLLGWISGFAQTNGSSANATRQPTPAIESGSTFNSNRIFNRRSNVAQAERWYTIPDLSILAGSRALTSLVGRVYRDDDITNPWLFKVMAGRENLTANFQDLPAEIDGMIFEGYATGNWPLGCVRGELIAATFVFVDGTVKSAYPHDPGSRPELNGAEIERLGYITDRWGNPCVSGKRISDAPEFLSQQVLLATAQGYARGLRDAETQVQQRVDSDGNPVRISQVIGEASRFGAYSGVAEGFEEGASWLQERFKNSFDVIYVPPGAGVDVHIQQELWIDKLLHARKIRYARPQKKHRRRID